MKTLMKILTTISLLLFILAAVALDSESWVPVYVCIGSLAVFAATFFGYWKNRIEM